MMKTFTSCRDSPSTGPVYKMSPISSFLATVVANNSLLIDFISSRLIVPPENLSLQAMKLDSFFTKLSLKAYFVRFST